MNAVSRRRCLKQSFSLGVAAILARPLVEMRLWADEEVKSRMKFGLCTYLWGQDWDLPTILANCERSQVLGVELRTEHKHGVEPSLSRQQRQEVKKRFADSPVTFVGLGTNQCFDSPMADQVERSIEGAKAFLQLSHDCGGSGVKVKPNDFHRDVPHEKTIEQIGQSLKVLGRCAADLDQQVRLEVHGDCRELPVIKQIMDVADHSSVRVCWNCNADMDLAGDGLEHNFNLVKARLGATTHVHELDGDRYPFQQLIDLLVRADYGGWILLEGYRVPENPTMALSEQRVMFESMLAAGRR